MTCCRSFVLGNEGDTMTDWKERAERAEAELARLRSVEPIGWYDSESGKTVFGVKPASKPWSPSAQWLPFFAAPPAQPAEPVQRLSDERIMHFWDIHAGMPTEKYPLNYKDVRAFARAIEAAIVPPGYVVVPVEPTEAMTEAGEFSVNMNYMDCLNSAIALHAYRAMIAAAGDKP